ncbi:MAG: hypothetical protein MRY57_00005 [Candidatus Pacebacteria bacterium]|nr:hypothetical protein [Candidatus Paceibacterota bacterium]
MNKDYTKVLWKIEELWKKYFTGVEAITDYSDVLDNYENNTSKYYDDFHLVDSFDFTASNESVHVDDYGSYQGLLHSQLVFKDKPTYLFDNHNKMLYSLVELYNINNKELTVVHIDAHPDDAKFQGQKITELNLQNIKKYIAETRISDFYDALSETNIIEKILLVTHSDSFEFFLPPEEPYILSLDIDIFGPEGDFCDLEDKVRATALAWSMADAVCIATSPGFIDQKFAQEIIEIFIHN